MKGEPMTDRIAIFGYGPVGWAAPSWRIGAMPAWMLGSRPSCEN
jgi:hypothetical protein